MPARSAKTDPQRDALIADLVDRMRRQLEEQLPRDKATLDQIEDVAGKIGRQVSRDIQRKLVEESSKQNKTSQATCTCGRLARHKGQQPRTIVTTRGALTVERTIYHCPVCQHSFAPLDRELGLDSGSTTTQVRLWIVLLAGQMPFAQAATTLQMLTGVALSASSIERHSVLIGSSHWHVSSPAPAGASSEASGGSVARTFLHAASVVYRLGWRVRPLA